MYRREFRLTGNTKREWPLNCKLRLLLWGWSWGPCIFVKLCPQFWQTILESLTFEGKQCLVILDPLWSANPAVRCLEEQGAPRQSVSNWATLEDSVRAQSLHSYSSCLALKSSGVRGSLPTGLWAQARRLPVCSCEAHHASSEGQATLKIQGNYYFSKVRKCWKIFTEFGIYPWKCPQANFSFWLVGISDC